MRAERSDAGAVALVPAQPGIADGEGRTITGGQLRADAATQFAKRLYDAVEQYRRGALTRTELVALWEQANAIDKTLVPSDGETSLRNAMALIAPLKWVAQETRLDDEQIRTLTAGIASLRTQMRSGGVKAEQVQARIGALVRTLKSTVLAPDARQTLSEALGALCQDAIDAYRQDNDVKLPMQAHVLQAIGHQVATLAAGGYVLSTSTTLRKQIDRFGQQAYDTFGADAGWDAIAELKAAYAHFHRHDLSRADLAHTLAIARAAYKTFGERWHPNAKANAQAFFDQIDHALQADDAAQSQRDRARAAADRKARSSPSQPARHTARAATAPHDIADGTHPTTIIEATQPHFDMTGRLVRMQTARGTTYRLVDITAKVHDTGAALKSLPDGTERSWVVPAAHSGSLDRAKQAARDHLAGTQQRLDTARDVDRQQAQPATRITPHAVVVQSNRLISAVDMDRVEHDIAPDAAIYAAANGRAITLKGSDLINQVGMQLKWMPTMIPLPGRSSVMYEGDTLTEGILPVTNAIRKVGGDAPQVVTIPVWVQARDAKTGAREYARTALFKVVSPTGDRYVDNVGRIYDSFDAWKSQNRLGATNVLVGKNGQVTFDAHGKVVLEAFNNARFDNQTLPVIRGGVMLLGTAAGAAAVLETGGAALPLVMRGLWAFGAIDAGATIKDLSDHGRAIDLKDPEVRVALINGAASVASLGALAVAKPALLEALLVGGAQALDVAAIGDGGINYVRNFNKMSQQERILGALQLLSTAGLFTAISAKNHRFDVHGLIDRFNSAQAGAKNAPVETTLRADTPHADKPHVDTPHIDKPHIDDHRPDSAHANTTHQTDRPSTTKAPDTPNDVLRARGLARIEAHGTPGRDSIVAAIADARTQLQLAEIKLAVQQLDPTGRLLADPSVQHALHARERSLLRGEHVQHASGAATLGGSPPSAVPPWRNPDHPNIETLRPLADTLDARYAARPAQEQSLTSAQWLERLEARAEQARQPIGRYVREFETPTSPSSPATPPRTGAQRLEHVEHQLRELEARLTDTSRGHTTRAEQIEQTVRALRAELDGLRHQTGHDIPDLRQRIDAATRRLDTLEAELRARFDGVSNATQALHQRVEGIEQQVDRLEAHLREQEDRLARNDLQGEHLREALRQTFDVIDREIGQLRQTLDVHDIPGLRQTVERLALRLRLTRARLTSLEQRHIALERRVGAAETRLDQAGGAHQQLEARVTQLEQDLIDARRRLEGDIQQRPTYDELDRLDQRLQALIRQESSNRTASQTRLNDELRLMRTELIALRDRVDRLQAQGVAQPAPAGASGTTAGAARHPYQWADEMSLDDIPPHTPYSYGHKTRPFTVVEHWVGVAHDRLQEALAQIHDLVPVARLDRPAPHVRSSPQTTPRTWGDVQRTLTQAREALHYISEHNQHAAPTMQYMLDELQTMSRDLQVAAGRPGGNRRIQELWDRLHQMDWDIQGMVTEQGRLAPLAEYEDTDRIEARANGGLNRYPDVEPFDELQSKAQLFKPLLSEYKNGNRRVVDDQGVTLISYDGRANKLNFDLQTMVEAMGLNLRTIQQIRGNLDAALRLRIQEPRTRAQVVEEFLIGFGHMTRTGRAGIPPYNIGIRENIHTLDIPRYINRRTLVGRNPRTGLLEDWHLKLWERDRGRFDSDQDPRLLQTRYYAEFVIGLNQAKVIPDEISAALGQMRYGTPPDVFGGTRRDTSIANMVGSPVMPEGRNMQYVANYNIPLAAAWFAQYDRSLMGFRGQQFRDQEGYWLSQRNLVLSGVSTGVGLASIGVGGTIAIKNLLRTLHQSLYLATSNPLIERATDPYRRELEVLQGQEVEIRERMRPLKERVGFNGDNYNAARLKTANTNDLKALRIAYAELTSNVQSQIAITRVMWDIYQQYVAQGTVARPTLEASARIDPWDSNPDEVAERERNFQLQTGRRPTHRELQQAVYARRVAALELLLRDRARFRAKDVDATTRNTLASQMSALESSTLGGIDKELSDLAIKLGDRYQSIAQAVTGKGTPGFSAQQAIPPEQPAPKPTTPPSAPPRSGAPIDETPIPHVVPGNTSLDDLTKRIQALEHSVNTSNIADVGDLQRRFDAVVDAELQRLQKADDAIAREETALQRSIDVISRAQNSGQPVKDTLNAIKATRETQLQSAKNNLRAVRQAINALKTQRVTQSGVFATLRTSIVTLVRNQVDREITAARNELSQLSSADYRDVTLTDPRYPIEQRTEGLVPIPTLKYLQSQHPEAFTTLNPNTWPAETPATRDVVRAQVIASVRAARGRAIALATQRILSSGRIGVEVARQATLARLPNRTLAQQAELDVLDAALGKDARARITSDAQAYFDQLQVFKDPAAFYDRVRPAAHAGSHGGDLVPARPLITPGT